MISDNDKAVLNAIFNPFEPNFSATNKETTTKKEDEIDPIFLEIKRREIDCIQLAEKGDYEAAEKGLSLIIKEHANYASALNNRAQVYQLKGDLSSAIQDLEKAIQLSTKNTEMYSEQNKRTLAQALCQRALISRLNGKEEESARDFAKAAQLGSDFAKKQMVKLNPYAALCNQMLQKMMRNIQEGKSEDSN